MPTRSHTAGLTLIELMITVAIVAILAAVAVPSFNTFFASSRAQSQSAMVVEALNYARSEAVRRGRAVGVATTGGIAWQQGWVVFLDANNNGARDAGEGVLVQRAAFAGNATLTGPNAPVVFNNRGYLAGAAPGAVRIFDYCFPTGFDNQERRIQLNHVGHVQAGRRVCP